MKRLFGVKKEKAPGPTLDDATGSVSPTQPQCARKLFDFRVAAVPSLSCSVLPPTPPT